MIRGFAIGVGLAVGLKVADEFEPAVRRAARKVLRYLGLPSVAELPKRKPLQRKPSKQRMSA